MKINWRHLGQKFAPWIVWGRQIARNRWVKRSLQVLILGLCGFYLYSNFQSIQSLELSLSVNPFTIIVAFAGLVASIFIGVQAWWLSLRAVGENLPWLASARIHIQANLAKYLPGYAWQLVGKAFLTKQAGLKAEQVGLIMVVELAELFLAGLGLAGLTFPSEIMTFLGWRHQGFDPTWLIRLGGGVLLILFPLGITWFAGRRQKRSPSIVQSRLIYAASGAMLAGWLLNGVCFWLLAGGVSPMPVDRVDEFIFILTISFLLGFLIIIVPGSFGVRESIIVFLLSPFLAGPLAVLIALLLRAVLIVSDVSSMGLLHLIEHIASRPKDHHNINTP